MNKKKGKRMGKRKREDDEKYPRELKHEVVEEQEDESNSKNSNHSDCSVGEQKPDSGSASEVPGPRENSNLKEERCESVQNDNTSDQPEAKHFESDGAKKGGMLLFSGGTNWDLIGRKELPKHIKDSVGPKLWGPHRLSSLRGIRVAFVASGSTACHSVIITEEGRAMTWGRNDKEQLGHCDNIRRDSPCIVDSLKEHNLISASCGRSHTLFLSDRGIVYSCGDNKMGQCGVGSKNDTVKIPTMVQFTGPPVKKVACGAKFSVIVDSKGGMYTFGCPEYGQLGHNSDGQYFVASNKLGFRCEHLPRRVTAYIEKTKERVTLVDDVEIADVACGVNHSVAVDTKKRCFTWGFAGYGRLGHAETKNELVPRLVKSFGGLNKCVKHVYAGGTYSMAVSDYDVLFFWGQNKRTGEATMYPKPVRDLAGWKVHDVGCANTSIVVIADESVVAWGSGLTYGELCYGEGQPKSSTAPKVAKTLDGLHIMKVACGYAHTLLIARDETEEDHAKLNALPEFSP